jgi:hypothetical protein
MKKKPVQPLVGFTFRDWNEPFSGGPKNIDPRWIFNATFALWKMRLPRIDMTPTAVPSLRKHGAIHGWQFARAMITGSKYKLVTPPETTPEYLSGFAYGIECFVAEMERGQRIGSTDRMAILEMFVKHSDTVCSFRSLNECHNWLVKMMPKNTYNRDSVKRLEKICQDIGKTFAPPGRPRLK